MTRGLADGASAGGGQVRAAREGGAVGFAGRCAVRLGLATALALPSAAWLTDVSVNASLSVLGFDAFGAGIELHGHLGAALLLGALWGAGAGLVGAGLACATGAAGALAAPLARGDAGGGALEPGGGARRQEAAGSASPPGHTGGLTGPYAPGAPSYRPPNPATNPYLRLPDDPRGPQDARHGTETETETGSGKRPGGGQDQGRDRAQDYGPGRGQRDRQEHQQGRRDAQGAGQGREGEGSGERSRPRDGSRPQEPPPPGSDDVYGAPTVVRPMGPAPRAPRGRPSPRPDDGPPPPPPPPPPAPGGPRTPRGSR